MGVFSQLSVWMSELDPSSMCEPLREDETLQPGPVRLGAGSACVGVTIFVSVMLLAGALWMGVEFLGAPTASEERAPVSNGVVVYYFHSSWRCPSCIALERKAHDVIVSAFGETTDGGQIRWCSVNYELPAYRDDAERYGVFAPSIVVVKFEEGEPVEWANLTGLQALLDDDVRFRRLLVSEVNRIVGKDVTGGDRSEH